MKVTVCVTHFNEPDVVVCRALESIKAQTVQPADLILINDGGNLGGLAEKEFQAAGARIFKITNRGLPSARNTGIMLAQTEAIMFLDADDWIREDYLAKTLPLLEDVDVVLTGLQEHGPSRNGCYNAGYDRPFNLVDEEILWSYNRFFYCALFRRQLLAEVGGYHPAMAGWPGVSGGFEDWSLWIELIRRKARFAAVDEPLLNYNTATPGSMLSRAEANRETLVAEMHRHHRRENR